MAPAIKAIETRYKGCRFRSRLEARWAVFFDSLGVQWTYEDEGYESLNGDERIAWLPDFCIPGWNMLIEVKAAWKDCTDYDVSKIVKIIDVHGGPDFIHPSRGDIGSHDDYPWSRFGVLLLDQIPNLEPGDERMSFVRLYWDKGVRACNTEMANGWFEDREDDMGIIFNYWDSPSAIGRAFRWFMDSGRLEYGRGQVTTYSDEDEFGVGDRTLVEACRAARSARFEHGESGFAHGRSR